MDEILSALGVSYPNSKAGEYIPGIGVRKFTFAAAVASIRLALITGSEC